MTEVSGDPFATKGKVKVNGGNKPAEAAETCKTLYGSDVKTFLADYREALEERKDLKEFRRIAETLHIPAEEFCKALYPRDFSKRKAS